MALDAELELKTKLSPEMMRTTIPKETTLPDETGQPQPVETAEEYDYNEFDLMYLQKYGRA